MQELQEAPAPTSSPETSRSGELSADLVLALGTSTAPERLEEQRALQARLSALGVTVQQQPPPASAGVVVTAAGGGAATAGFLLVRAPFDLLATQAEASRLEMPLEQQLEVDDAASATSSARSVSCLKSVAGVPREEGRPVRERLFSAPFQQTRLELFLNSADRENFFTPAQRSLMLYEALAQQPEFSRCLATGALADCYPMHSESERDELLLTWASARQWWRLQPLELVRRYLGEKIAMYFAWLGFYNKWLAPLALLGCLAFLYGLATVAGDATADEVCRDARVADLPLCPACDRACDFTRLGQSCLYSRLVRVFDNEATVLLSVLTALWAACLLDFWRRRQAELRRCWNVADLRLEPAPRPEFVRRILPLLPGRADATEAAFDEVEAAAESQRLLQEGLPRSQRAPRLCLSAGTVTFMLCLVLSVVVGVIVYRLCILAVLTSTDTLPTSRVRIITSLTAAMLNIMCIMSLNILYRKLALRLTELELRRTDAGYENSYTLKVYCFQFVNYYASVFYIAFFKGQFHGRPGHYARLWLDARPEECDPAGCMVELVIQMLVVFVVKQLVNTTTEMGLPTVKRIIVQRMRARKLLAAAEAGVGKREEPQQAQWEADWALAPTGRLQLFEEYLEMVLQFGFLTLFMAAMPLAPLFALLNNVLELRLDAWKMLRLMRRPLARRASDIGAWEQILSSLGALSLVTNAVVVGFTSEQVPRLVYRLTAGNGSFDGYIEWRLSRFNTVDFEAASQVANSSEAICYYRDFRQPELPYNYRPEHWHVLAARLAFVLVFEHLVLALRALVMRLVPSVPVGVRRQIRRERRFLRQALFRQLDGKTDEAEAPV